jgi:hypothetical protein
MRKKLKVNAPHVRRNPILKQVATKARIRVQLDSRTMITIPDMSALKLWTDTYPNAKVVATA